MAAKKKKPAPKKSAAAAKRAPPKKPAPKKAQPKKAQPKKPASKKTASKKTALAAKNAAPKSAATKKAATKRPEPPPSAAPSKPASKDYGRRADFGAGADAYLAKLKGEPRAILDELRGIIKRAVPGIEESMKWGRPVYSKGGLICYIKAFTNHVSLGFMQHADKLEDPDGRLMGESGIGAHVKLTSAKDIDAERFTTWLKIAAAANAAK